MNESGKIEPIIFLLAMMIVMFTCLLVVVEKWFNSDGQLFQVVSGMLTGLMGAFLMRIKPPGKKEDAADVSINKPIGPVNISESKS